MFQITTRNGSSETYTKSSRQLWTEGKSKGAPAALLQSSFEPGSSGSSGRCTNWQLWKQLCSCDHRSLIKTALPVPGSRSRSFAALLGRLIYKKALTTRNFGSSEIWLNYTQFLTLFYQMKNKFDNFYVKFCTH